MKQQILKIKGVKICPSCKGELPEEVAYCPNAAQNRKWLYLPRNQKKRTEGRIILNPENRTRRKTVPDVIPNVMRKVMWKIMLSAARKLPERTRKKAAGANAR